MIGPTIAFFIVSIAVSCLALNRFIAFKNQPSLVFSFSVVLAILIPISTVFLLPIDLLSSNESEKSNFFYVDSRIILNLWRFDYWTAFILMWSFLPFLQEYYRSGSFTTRNKINDSIRANLKFQLVVGSIGIVGLVYFFVKFGFKFSIFKSLLIALSHTYSLVLSLWLMSHGLVNIPRRRFHNSLNLSKQLEVLYLNLPKKHDDMNDSLYNLKDICSVINNIVNLIDNDSAQANEFIYRDEILYLKSLVPLNLKLTNHIRSVEFSNLNQINLKILTNLHSTFKRDFTTYQSNKFEFEKSKQKILELEKLVEPESSNNDRDFGFIVKKYCVPVLNFLFALFLSVLSFIIIESEILHSTKYSIINFLLINNKISSTSKLVISIVFLCYMAFSALISLTRIKIFKIYHLFLKNSDPVSVVFFTMYANRLTIPLSYNFITLLQQNKLNSNFNKLLGNSINLSLLGEAFNEFLPRLILIPILLTFFNVFDKIKSKFQLNDYYFSDGVDSSDNNGSQMDGENLIGNKTLMINEAKNIIRMETSLNVESERQSQLQSQSQTGPQAQSPSLLSKFTNLFKSSDHELAI